ncbi:hypothetical protein [Variovorax paradoxus]|uniref:hypothetical protein n=1 Tax=Variovorax paradoxus TaxID=34073 RepID=UPI003D64D16C
MTNPRDKTNALATLRRRFFTLRFSTDHAAVFSFVGDLLDLHSAAALEYHYNLLLDSDTSDVVYDTLCRSFSMRGAAGEDYLHARFMSVDEPSLKATLLHVLGSFRTGNARRRKETAAHARAALASPHEELRCRGLWVIGWLGTSADIPRVGYLLTGDSAAINRQWAATTLMHIVYNHPSGAPAALNLLSEALAKETNKQALSGIVVAAQEITGKKLGLSATSHKTPSNDKLNAAMKRTRRMFGGAAQ